MNSQNNDGAQENFIDKDNNEPPIKDWNPDEDDSEE